MEQDGPAFCLDSVALFVFLTDDPQQNGMLLLTPVSEPVFNALSDRTNHFAPYGSLNNHHLIGGSSADREPIRRLFLLVL